MKNIYIFIGLTAFIAAGAFITYNSLDSDESTPVLAGHSISVHKTPTCGCCGEYVKYLKDQGAKVTVINHDNLTEERALRHIPIMLESCHFSEVEGYTVEGHVPAEVIVKLLEERPEIAGIALPEMPAGSPGMSGTKLTPFVIHQFTVEGGDNGIYMTL